MVRSMLLRIRVARACRPLRGAQTAIRVRGQNAQGITGRGSIPLPIEPTRDRHSERSEESGTGGEILRFAQDDDEVLRMTMEDQDGDEVLRMTVGGSG